MSKYSGLTIDELFRAAQIDAVTELEKALVARMEEYQDEQFEEANEQAREAFSADRLEMDLLKEKLKAREKEIAELQQNHSSLLEVCAQQSAKILELEDDALDAKAALQDMCD